MKDKIRVIIKRTVVECKDELDGYRSRYENLLQKKRFGIWFTVDRESIPEFVIKKLGTFGILDQSWKSRFINGKGSRIG